MNRTQKLLPYALVVPGIALLCVLMFYPFLRNVAYGFTNYKLANPDFSYVGFANYVEAVSSKEFIQTLLTTLLWVSLNLVYMVLLGTLAAMLMNSRQIKGVFLLELVLLLPWVLPEAVTGYTWKLLLNYKSGIYYKMLLSLSIIPEKYDIFAHATSAMLACVSANVWRSFPLVALTTLAKLRTLPTEQVEAGVLDGVNRRQLFFHIELPHIRPVLLSVGTLCFIWTFNAFGIISVMTNGGPAKATQVVSVLMQKAAFQFFDYSMASTYAMLILLILVAVVLVLNALPALLSRAVSGGREKRHVL